MKRTIIITGIIAAVAVAILIIIGRLSKSKDIANLYVEARRGRFDIIVSTTGELEAENSQDIIGPEFRQSRRIRFMDIKITDLVPEGTEVQKGDYVATLDRTSFDNTLKDELERLTTYETNLEVKMLDTAVTLSNLRDNIKNLRFAVEEAEITLQQSKYEPPTTIRQAEISLDKAQRSLDQAIKGYGLRVEQARADIRTIKNNLNEQRQLVSDLQLLLANFVITAPSDGMVIYKRDRTNTKRRVGSSISPWDNVVATLPDMSSMISKTYVNEIDISKVKNGQSVEIMVDAFPDKLYTGVVTSVANIGEQLPNADAKVFEVLIKVNGTDPILRPSMTTGNKIITKTIEDVIYVPLETVHTGTDSIPFVYTKNGAKQVVLLGESNENNVIVEQGLDEGASIYLNTPEEPEKFRLAGMDLIEVNKQRAQERRNDENRVREEIERRRQKMQPGPEGVTPEMMQRFRGNQRNIPGGDAGDTVTTGRTTNMQNNGRQQGIRRDTAFRRANSGQAPVQGPQTVAAERNND